ncbi:MAG: hypothetical protein WB992_10105 [Bryobacteraceae bacterium]
MKKNGLMILAALIASATGYAQVEGPPPGPPPPGAEFGHRVGLGPGPRGLDMWKVVKGAPYSAEISDQWVETLADGNTIQRTTTGRVARDNQGRTYVQETITGGPMSQNGPTTMTFISDPVAGYSYVLRPSSKTAIRRAIKAPPTGDNKTNTPPRGNSHPDSANRVESELGTQNIGGVNAQGKSVTHTIPAGAMGNAQPIVSTSETWYSPDLQIPVLAKRNDPRTGQSTYSVTNIQRGEPAASLFQVPSDYTIQDAPKTREGWGGGGPRPHGPPQ